jgi:hypothetical protein
MVRIIEQGPKIAEIQVASLAKKLGASLANDYKIFLLENNGGRPKPDIIDIEGLAGTPTDVQEFFAIGGEIEASELSGQLNFIRECCPDQHVLPIACDSFGSLFCLKVIGGVASSIVFCDLSNQSRNFYDVAPTFTEFLNKIREWE